MESIELLGLILRLFITAALRQNAAAAQQPTPAMTPAQPVQQQQQQPPAAPIRRRQSSTNANDADAPANKRRREQEGALVARPALQNRAVNVLRVAPHNNGPAAGQPQQQQRAGPGPRHAPPPPAAAVRPPTAQPKPARNVRTLAWDLLQELGPVLQRRDYANARLALSLLMEEARLSSNLEFLRVVAMAHIRAIDYGSALECFTRAASLQPHNPKPRLYMARLQQAMAEVYISIADEENYRSQYRSAARLFSQAIDNLAEASHVSAPEKKLSFLGLMVEAGNRRTELVQRADWDVFSRLQPLQLPDFAVIVA